MKVKINNRKFNVKSVITPEKILQGMMKKRFDDTFDGMLFFMEEDKKHCFWMKNCIIPLDIIFIQDNTITKVYNNCPPCNEDECENYCGSGNFVLELEGGSCEKFNLSEGDEIRLLF